MINKSVSRCAVVRFCYHSYDNRPNWTPLSPITNYLITESEVVTGKSQTEALQYWPSDSEVNTVGRGLRFSRNDRTVEDINLFTIWFMNFKRKEKNLMERKSSIYIRRCARLPIHSSSQTQGKTTQSVNFTYSVKNTGKMIVTASKRHFSIVVPRLDGGFFRTFVAKRQRI